MKMTMVNSGLKALSSLYYSKRNTSLCLACIISNEIQLQKMHRTCSRELCCSSDCNGCLAPYGLQAINVAKLLWIKLSDYNFYIVTVTVKICVMAV